MPSRSKYLKVPLVEDSEGVVGRTWTGGASTISVQRIFYLNPSSFGARFGALWLLQQLRLLQQPRLAEPAIACYSNRSVL